MLRYGANLHQSRCFIQNRITMDRSRLLKRRSWWHLLLQSSIFWDIMLCSPVEVNQSFRWTYCLHLQGWRVSHARNLHKADSKQNLLPAGCPLHAGFLLDLINDPESGGVISSKHQLTFIVLQNCRSHIFIVTAERTSNPTFIVDFPNQVSSESCNWFGRWNILADRHTWLSLHLFTS
jgi:hypothetical protein